MIAYHEGNGVLINLTDAVKEAQYVSYDDSVTQIDADNVQTAIENLNQYFADTFPGWVVPR